MHSVGTLGLPCPDGTDAAAAALYMQMLAERIEAETLALRNSLLPTSNPPTAIWRVTAAAFPIDTTGVAFVNMGPSDGSLLYSNYLINGLGPSVSENSQSFPEPGIYHVGWTLLMSETGAVTSGSGRSVEMVVFRDDPAGSVTVLNLTSQAAASPSGLDSYIRNGLVEIVGNPASYHMSLMWHHANGASTMQVNPNDCMIWLTKVGNADIIEVE